MSSTPQQTFYIVLPPPSPDAAGYARQVSRLMQKDEAEIKAKLQHPSWQVLRRYARRDNAEGFRNQLKAFGIDNLVLSDTQLAGALFMWMARANKGAGGLAFRDFSDQPLFCPFDDIVALCTGTVRRMDGTTTTLIDVHRKSTPITPRIDAALFDFASATGGKNDHKAFIASLYDPSRTEIDSDFDGAAPNMMEVVERGLATFPGELPPPAKALKADYDPKQLRLFDCYSLFSRELRVSAAG